MTTIKIDYDNKRISINQFERDLRNLMNLHNVKKVKYDYFKTRRGFHIYIHFPLNLEPKDVLLMQIFLGSDIKREFFNYQRIISGEIYNWNVLFKKKFIGGKKVSEETLIMSTEIEVNNG